ncbi:MAG: ribosome small subunit-dependent GTPase A [Solirubrobacterales bacterium]|nr:ribosome small subunit-dependent GTPase A [Solirubrobacterales bacterium]
MQLEAFDVGRRPELAAQLAELGEPELTGGRVLAQHRGYWLVAATDGETSPFEPRLLTSRGRLREDPPGVGDWVAIDPDGAIAAVLARHGTLMRQAVGGPTSSQVLAANVDLALVVESLPDTNRSRVERLVALAMSASVPAVLVLTKADLDPDWEARAIEISRELPLTATIAVCAKDATGMDALRAHLLPGATAALLGRSGAGKSTLVNALLGVDRQATRPVRAGDGRGRHVTVTRELIGLPGGALIIDTPGLREIGLWSEPEDMFVEINQLAADCRFADCQHETEPGCAVRDAVNAEDLSAWRNLAIEQAAIADRKAVAADRKQRSRLLRRRVKAAKRESRGQ